MIQHILVGIDGSDDSRKAAAFARQLAGPGTRISFLYVLEPPRVVPVLDSFVLARPDVTEEDTQAVKRLLDQVSLGMPPEQVERLIEIGTAAETLCDQADKLGVDLIVVGARGLGPVGRWVVGSVSDRVVHHARRPVTVVR